jgi:microcystin-dependent protein
MSAKSTQDFSDYPVPIGSLIAYAGAIDYRLPKNYLICDGATLLRADYPELFSVIGTTFGSATANDFLIPNLVGFIPKCSATAGVIGANPSSSGVTFNDISLTSAELPSINGIGIGANINGSFPTGSSTSSTAKIDENDIGGGHPMTSWNTTSTVDMTSNSAPVFNYTNGTGTVAPIDFTLNNADDFVVKNIEMVYIIKTKNQFFP